MKRSLLLLVLTVVFCCPKVLWAANAGDFTIAIDAGHGAQTAGKRTFPFTHTVTHTYNGYTVTVNQGEEFREHIGNAGIAENLAQILTAIGFKVVRVAFNDMNGADDAGDPGLNDRLAAIRNAGAVVSVSCHHDAFGNGWNSAKGLSIWVWNGGGGESRRLADIMLPKLIAVRGQQNRGVRENVFALCDLGRSHCRASILIEHAFMTNEDEAHNLVCNPEVWHAYAVAEAQAICEFLGVPFNENAAAAGGAPAAPLFSDEEMREMGWDRNAASGPTDGSNEVDMDEVPKSEMGITLEPPQKEEDAAAANEKLIAQKEAKAASKKAKARARRKNNNAAILTVLGLVGIAAVAGFIMMQNNGGGRKTKRRSQRW